MSEDLRKPHILPETLTYGTYVTTSTILWGRVLSSQAGALPGVSLVVLLHFRVYLDPKEPAFLGFLTTLSLYNIVFKNGRFFGV